MLLSSGHHLTYCTNIHAGETWPEVFQSLRDNIPHLKQRIAGDRAFGIGLRLSDLASRELLLEPNLEQFQQWLDQENCYVFTLNGFPFGGFHGQVVKDQVYALDWSHQERCQYTQRLIQILARLLPEGMDGSISTLPISYKPWFFRNENYQRKAHQSENQYGSQSNETVTNLASCYRRSTSFLVENVAMLVQLKQQTGQLIHLGLEPEPDGALENSTEVIQFFEAHLLLQGSAELSEYLGISESQARQHLLEHVRLCYDTCHFALAYESPVEAIEQLSRHGIKLSKIQLSSAVQIEIPSSASDRITLSQQLLPLVEATYLHQVVERLPNGELHHYRDLDAALNALATTTAVEWRIHFHVPIFQADYGVLGSTQLHLKETLIHLNQLPDSPHLEIETYTWDVLPPDMKLDLQTSIEREFRWVLQLLTDVHGATQLQPTQLQPTQPQSTQPQTLLSSRL